VRRVLIPPAPIFLFSITQHLRSVPHEDPSSS
jgi:hypothetical protein